jgi:hypothetical protein
MPIVHSNASNTQAGENNLRPTMVVGIVRRMILM